MYTFAHLFLSTFPAEDLFAGSVAADDDKWLPFQVKETVVAKQLLSQL
jgi:hypothetical protein